VTSSEKGAIARQKKMRNSPNPLTGDDFKRFPGFKFLESSIALLVHYAACPEQG
jgi:hypothetical protein